MYTITSETISDGHEKVVRLIMGSQDFNDVLTEDKEQTFEYPTPVNIHINHPNTTPFFSPSLMFGELSLDAYKNQILQPRQLIDRPGHPDFSYLYSNLIFDYPKNEPYKSWQNTKTGASGCSELGKNTWEDMRLMRVDWMAGNGRGDGTNQIDYIVEKLQANPSSRRCVVTLFEPRGHPKMDDPPCLNHIQFLIRNGELNCHALFRSNDMLSAWGNNAYALMHLQKHVIDRLRNNGVDVEWGWLETTSISAHIYWKRDHHELNEFKKRWC